MTLDQTTLEESPVPIETAEQLLEIIQADYKAAIKTEHLQIASEWRRNSPDKYYTLKTSLKEIKEFKATIGVTEWERAVLQQTRADKERARAIAEALQKSAANEKRSIHAEVKLKLPADVIKRHTFNTTKTWMSPLGIIHIPSDDAEEIELTNFSAVVTGFVVDQRSPDEAFFEIEAIANEKVYTFTLPGRNIERLDWVWTKLQGHGRLPNAGPAHRNHAWNTILEASYPIPTKHVFGKTGWHIYDNQRMYLYAGGAVGGTAKVDLPTDILQLFELPPAHTGEVLHRAIHECIKLFTLGNNAQPALTWPLFSTPWVAALGHRSIVNVQAEQQTGKSTVVSIVQNFFGMQFHEKRLPVLLPNATAFGVLSSAAMIGDSVFVVDDINKTGNQKADAEMIEKVNRIVRAVFGNSGKLKGTKESRLTQDPVPRSLVILTSEVIPTLNSILNRQVILRLDQKLLTKKEVDILQDKCKAGVFAGTMAAYLEWAIPKWDELQSYKSLRTRAIRDELIAGGASDRTSEELAGIALGLDLFLMFAIDVEAITEEQGQQLWNDAQPGFVATSKEQQDTQHQEDICHRFVEIVSSLLQGGKVSLACTNAGVTPPTPELWGWRKQSSAQGADYVPASNRIGFLDADDELVYLNCSDVVDLVQRQGLPVSRAELPTQLHKRGLLAKVEHAGEGETATIKSRLVRVRYKEKGTVYRTAGYLCLPASLFRDGIEHDQAQLGLSNSPKIQHVETNEENS